MNENEENQKKPKIPHRMSRLAFPKAKYGVYLALVIIFFALEIILLFK